MTNANPRGRSGEREMLTGFLDWYRAIIERKVQGLTMGDASREMTGTGLSPLGVIKHLGWVEYGWFRYTFAGEDVERPPRKDDDNAIQFRIGPDDTVESVLNFYRSEGEHARQITAGAASLDDLGARVSRFMGTISLRWILVHMVEETARHAGHLDLMREAIDGQTGYL
ncbi:MAG: DinB family protein [Acidimicrobiales bacterium]